MSFLFKYKILINSAALEQKLCLALLHRIVAITLKNYTRTKQGFIGKYTLITKLVDNFSWRFENDY